jgi:cysteine desulfurase
MRSVDALKGSLGRVVQLTRNFTSESSPRREVIDAISAAFEAGWADPKKLSQASARASALRAAAIDQFAGALAVSPSAIEIVGEPALLHQLAIEGYLRNGMHLVTSNLDVGKVRAVAHRYAGPKSALQSDRNGRLQISSKTISDLNGARDGALISLQERNGEIGVTQNVPGLIEDLSETVHAILDCTKSIPRALDQRISAATYEATSWQGPTGIGFLLINNSEKYRYPLPHLAPIRVPGTYSLPLLIGAIVALDLFQSNIQAIRNLRPLAIRELSTIPGLTVIGDEIESDSRYLSLVIDGAIAEEITRELNDGGIEVDAGSACSPDYLAPSHVITSLGYKSEGHLRITLKTEHKIEDVEALCNAIKSITLRS